MSKSIYSDGTTTITSRYAVSDSIGYVEWAIAIVENGKTYNFSVCGRLDKDNAKTSLESAIDMLLDLCSNKDTTSGEYFIPLSDQTRKFGFSWNAEKCEMHMCSDGSGESIDTTFPLPLAGITAIARNMIQIVGKNILDGRSDSY